MTLRLWRDFWVAFWAAFWAGYEQSASCGQDISPVRDVQDKPASAPRGQARSLDTIRPDPGLAAMAQLMPDPIPQLPQPGDAFVLASHDGRGFGCVQAVFPEHGVALVTMQSGQTGTIPLAFATIAVAALRAEHIEAES